MTVNGIKLRARTVVKKNTTSQFMLEAAML